jgi:hypothetical protein
MRRRMTALFVAASALLACLSALAQTAPRATPVSANATLSPEEVIRRFTTKESELREIWKDFAYQQESTLQVLGPAKTVSGEFFQVSEFVFNDAGKRVQRILKAPPSSLDRAGLIMTAEDHNAFINLQPFALTAEDLKDYTLNYVGKERIDSLNTYVFDVTPNVMRDPRALDRLKKQKVEGRYFQGRVWVDDQDFQIVKTSGKTVPEFKQRFPRFETYRENIDGRYWLPTYTAGEDTLDFEDGLSINVRLLVRYKNYRKFNSDVKIIDDAVVAPEEPAQESQQRQPQAKPEAKRPEESGR